MDRILKRFFNLKPSIQPANMFSTRYRSESDAGETHTFVPDAQPWQPGAWTTLWQIPGSGPAGQLGSIEGVTLFDPVLWSADGSRLAFIQQPDDQDSTAMSRLMIADGKGISANPYAGGDALTVTRLGF